MSASTFSVTIAMTMEVPSLRWNLQDEFELGLPLPDVFLAISLPKDLDLYRLDIECSRLHFRLLVGVANIADGVLSEVSDFGVLDFLIAHGRVGRGGALGLGWGALVLWCAAHLGVSRL